MTALARWPWSFTLHLGRNIPFPAPIMNLTMILLQAVALVLINLSLVQAQPANIVSMPCRDRNNFDPSSCLFAGDHCDFNANFSLFYDQAIPYYKYIENPVPENAEFIIESGIPRIDNGALSVSLIPPKSPSDMGTATIISTSRFLHYGVFEARFKVSGHGGVVTSFIGFSNVKDEIDLEITGYDNRSVQANWYYRGMADTFASNGSSVNGYIGKANSSVADFYHTYTINWTQDSITWFVDGQLMHRSLKSVSGKKGFPDTPMRISFGLWEAQPNSTWAGNMDFGDWSQPITTSFQSLRVSCLAGPHNISKSVSGDQLTHPSTGYNPDHPYGSSAAISMSLSPSIYISMLVFLLLLI